MNPLDLGVVAVVGLSAIFAFARGLVREALSIVAWAGAAAITLYGFNLAYGFVEKQVNNVLLSQIITGLGLFVVSLVVLTILTGIVARLVHATGLSPIDRTLGFIFGMARGLLLVCLAYLLLDVTVPLPGDRPEWIREAKSGALLHQGADMLKGLLPESFKVKTSEAADELIRKVDPKAAAKAEADKAMRALQTPGPTPPPAPAAAPTPAPQEAPPPSYPARDKKELDRLMGTQR